MKIGMVTDSLAHLSFDDMLDTAARLGIRGVEFNAANWTSAPHLNLKALLESAAERRAFMTSVKQRGLEIIALNASGNQLHPTEGETQSAAVYTLGYGNGQGFWKDFCYRLRMAGYDGWLSIEHEDVMLSREEGVKKSVELLQAVAPFEASDYQPQEF